MQLFGFKITRAQKKIKNDDDFEEIDYKTEVKKVKLDFERQAHELKLATLKKKEQLEQAELDYKIMEQKSRMAEDFEDDNEIVDEILDEATENDDVPKWLQPIVAPMIAKMINSNNTATGNNVTSLHSTNNGTDSTAAVLSLTNDELIEIKRNMKPQDIAFAKAQSDEFIKGFIKNKYPTITEECLNRAITILRS